jgi:hypothetical protein
MRIAASVILLAETKNFMLLAAHFAARGTGAASSE